MRGEVLPDWGWIFKEVTVTFIVMAGLVGNCLSFVVMKSKYLRVKSYSHYLCALAVFDSLVLINQQIRLVDELLLYFGKPGVWSVFTDISCKIYAFSESVCYLMSSWLIVTMAGERLLVVFFPFRRNSLVTQKGAVAVILSMFALMSYTQVFRIIMVKKVGSQCESSPRLAVYYTNLHFYFYQLTLILLLPFVAVCICNVLVVCKIKSVGRATSNSESTRFTRCSQRRHKTTMMLLTICFTYVLTLLPLVVLTFTIVIVLKTCSLDLARHFVFTLTPWKDVFLAISQVNYAANFYIYILSGSNFRIQLSRIFFKDKMTNTNSTKTREDIMLL
ncbi:somatostatin receptor type 1-like [Gigantopelta aegis]|uniref:somatostatin receptor type 1-like n=1 Tax=Gigantopelta aegis TaxID=1735272 RepID=UPI001B88E396|nr:somatostatin receptor type 1-like [Gigantopelta aegis]